MWSIYCIMNHHCQSDQCVNMKRNCCLYKYNAGNLQPVGILTKKLCNILAKMPWCLFCVFANWEAPNAFVGPLENGRNVTNLQYISLRYKLMWAWHPRQLDIQLPVMTLFCKSRRCILSLCWHVVTLYYISSHDTGWKMTFQLMRYIYFSNT